MANFIKNKLFITISIGTILGLVLISLSYLTLVEATNTAFDFLAHTMIISLFITSFFKGKIVKFAECIFYLIIIATMIYGVATIFGGLDKTQYFYSQVNKSIMIDSKNDIELKFVYTQAEADFILNRVKSGEKDSAKILRDVIEFRKNNKEYQSKREKKPLIDGYLFILILFILMISTELNSKNKIQHISIDIKQVIFNSKISLIFSLSSIGLFIISIITLWDVYKLDSKLISIYFIILIIISCLLYYIFLFFNYIEKNKFDTKKYIFLSGIIFFASILAFISNMSLAYNQSTAFHKDGYSHFFYKGKEYLKLKDDDIAASYTNDNKIIINFINDKSKYLECKFGICEEKFK